jgi:NADH:ubiquinone oxidoreductase subunit D
MPPVWVGAFRARSPEKSIDIGTKAMNFLSRGKMLADVSAIIGSLHIVFGEIDR